MGEDACRLSRVGLSVIADKPFLMAHSISKHSVDPHHEHALCCTQGSDRVLGCDLI